MHKRIVLLKNSPRIEFQLLDSGFQIIDETTESNSGFFSYPDLTSIQLHRPWFPRLAKWLRAFTWIFNGVPLFPDAESCKKASVVLHFGKKKIGMWLTDTHMARNAKELKELLEQKSASVN